MKRFRWLLLFLLLIPHLLKAQSNLDYGVFGGIASYMGDINPSRPFYSPSPAAGLILRYNLNPRQALRGSLIYGGLRGNDLDFSNDYQQVRASSFSGSVFEWSGMFEFNFLPYTTTGKWWDFTPYMAVGGAIAFVSTTELTYLPAIPFAVGFKVNVYKNMGLEVEYGFRKTFYDNFDGLTDNIDPAHQAWAHNNDWYMFSGVTFTWKMFNNLTSCPAYEDYEIKR